ncbi:helix-turn-helix transcriptional regulator [Paenibacillus flagellatus]|uniref:DNA-binding transcriptional regulator n=1 Tax=Paenibacillus flagellatus TaxID=2211139 RepID=A0A2V5KCG7_9BACL|nr:YafY family protein [Paenibacillus flagellatus]PYI57291.1 DNA-binding transcriptional regulator [Paenibacillus flagellatus]
MSKADNMIAILWLLRSGKRITAKQIAEELEIHVRTVYRCIDALCASGVPIVADAGHNGGYSLLQPLDGAPLFFDADEQKALVHASVFAQEAGYPHGEALERAIVKLKRYANEEQQEAIERHEAGLDVIHPPVDDSMGALLRQLERATAEGRTLSIAYQAGYDDDVTSRDIDPYGLVHWKSGWYVVGYCRLRGDIRSFRADRIRACAEAGGTFERPAGFSARDFFMAGLRPDPERSDEYVTVRLEGKPQAIADLCANWLFGGGLVERRRDGATFRLPAHTVYSRVPYALLTYGGSITGVEPPELKEAMRGVAEALADYYRTI